MTDRDAGQNGNPRDPPSASVAITAGAALFNEGQFLAARDVWEAERRPADDGGSGADGDTPDDVEQLLRGLAATAAATHRASDGDRSGTGERTEDAVAALASVSDPRGVALASVREWAERLAATPGDTEDTDAAAAPRVRIDGETPMFGRLSLAAAGLVAPALARAGEPGDPATLARAADFAREDRGTGRTEFAELLFAYLRTPDARPQVAARLGDHVDREARKRRDVDDLF